RHFIGRLKALRLVAKGAPADDHRSNGGEEFINDADRVTGGRKGAVVQPAIVVVRPSHKAVQRHHHIYKDRSHALPHFCFAAAFAACSLARNWTISRTRSKGIG